MFNFTSKKEKQILSRIDTCEKAREAYFSFKNKKFKVLALEKWNNLCLPLIESAIENKNATPLLCEEIPPKGETKKLFEEHLDELLSSIPNNQIIIFYEHLGYPSLLSRSNELIFYEIEKANSIDELLKINVTFYHTIPIIKARIRKMIALCKNYEEFENLEEYINTHCKKVGCPIDVDLRRFFIQKNEELILNALSTTTDIQTLYKYQKTVWPESRIDKIISERIKYLLTRS